MNGSVFLCKKVPSLSGGMMPWARQDAVKKTYKSPVHIHYGSRRCLSIQYSSKLVHAVRAQNIKGKKQDGYQHRTGADICSYQSARRKSSEIDRGRRRQASFQKRDSCQYKFFCFGAVCFSKDRFKSAGSSFSLARVKQTFSHLLQ